MADEATERITILLQAKDRDFARAMDRNNKLIAKFARDADKQTTAAARRIDANLKGLAGSAGEFGKAMVASIGAGLIAAALATVTTNLRSTIGTIADMVDQAARIGLTTDEFQGLQYGMKLAGVEAETFASSMLKFTQNIGDAGRGTGALKSILDANGISLRGVDGQIKSTSELLAAFADLLSGIPDEATRLSMITDAFGKSGAAMALAFENGSAGLRTMQEEAEKAGVIIEKEVANRAAELDDKFDKLTIRAQTFFKEVAVGAASLVDKTGSGLDNALLGSISDRALGGMDAGVLLGLDIEKALDSNADATKKASGDLAAYGANLRVIRDESIALAESLGRTADQLFDMGETAAAEKMYALAQRIGDTVVQFDQGSINGQTFLGVLKILGSQANILTDTLATMPNVDFSSSIASADRFQAVLGALTTAANNAYNAILRAIGMATRLPGPRGPVISHGGRAEQGEAPSTLAPGTSPRPRDKPFELGVPDLVTGGGSGGGTSSGANDSVREAEQLFEETRTSAEKYASALQDIEKLQKDGLISADTYARAITMIGEKYAETAKGMKEFEEGGKQAFVSFVTGAESAQDAISNLLDKLAEMLASDAWDSLVGGLRGTAAPAGGNLISGLLSGFVGLFGGGKSALPARANGGPVQAGRAYMVGERGPEPFIPSSNGMILPNSSLQSGPARAGGMSVVIGFDQSAGSFTAMVRDEAGRVVAQAAPKIVRQSLSAVQEANRATGAYLG